MITWNFVPLPKMVNFGGSRTFSNWNPNRMTYQIKRHKKDKMNAAHKIFFKLSYPKWRRKLNLRFY